MTRAVLLLVVICLAAIVAQAQLLNTVTKEQLIEYTAQNPFERFPDGRPRIPDSLLKRTLELSQEEVTNFRTQCSQDFKVLHPGKKMAGRAFTVQFMPSRQEVENVMTARAKATGQRGFSNQFAIDQLQPGDVLVVDLFGKIDGGTIVGDNLFYYVMKTTNGGGLVVDGAIRDLEGIQHMDMPMYYKGAHPSAIQGVMLTGVNVPVRIGNITVMPGDLVMGDAEGVCFVPPQQVTAMLDHADELHVHDEWTRKKFDEGKYKSSEIYGSPRDPALKKEYEEYLKKRLEEIRKK